MRYPTGKDEIEKIKNYMRLAAGEAKKSTCKKSQRGAIIVKDNEIIGRGYNKVTLDSLCNPCIREDIKDNNKVELCYAIHAEQMAIIDAINNKAKTGRFLNGSRMYNIKLKNGEMIPSGEPSCTVCSRMIYVAGIEVVLWTENGFAIYEPREFNEASFRYFLKNKGKNNSS